LRYIINVSDEVNEVTGNEIAQGHKFAWYREYSRLAGTKEEYIKK
jgi:hypothetical protein